MHEVATYYANDDAQRENLRIFPPHAAPDRACASPERSCLARHVVRLVDEQLDALSSGKDLLDILNHDILDLRELRLCSLQLVRGWRGVVLMHELLDRWTEGALERIWGTGCTLLRRRRGRAGQELVQM